MLTSFKNFYHKFNHLVGLYAADITVTSCNLLGKLQATVFMKITGIMVASNCKQTSQVANQARWNKKGEITL